MQNSQSASGISKPSQNQAQSQPSNSNPATTNTNPQPGSYVAQPRPAALVLNNNNPQSQPSNTNPATTTTNINPRANTNINPTTTTNINPRTKTNINPATTTTNINPATTTANINPRTTVINPTTTTSLNPRTTTNVNPTSTNNATPMSISPTPSNNPQTNTYVAQPRQATALLNPTITNTNTANPNALPNTSNNVAGSNSNSATSSYANLPRANNLNLNAQNNANPQNTNPATNPSIANVQNPGSNTLARQPAQLTPNATPRQNLNSQQNIQQTSTSNIRQPNPSIVNLQNPKSNPSGRTQTEIVPNGNLSQNTNQQGGRAQTQIAPNNNLSQNTNQQGGRTQTQIAPNSNLSQNTNQQGGRVQTQIAPNSNLSQNTNQQGGRAQTQIGPNNNLSQNTNQQGPNTIVQQGSSNIRQQNPSNTVVQNSGGNNSQRQQAQQATLISNNQQGPSQQVPTNNTQSQSTNPQMQNKNLQSPSNNIQNQSTNNLKSLPNQSVNNQQPLPNQNTNNQQPQSQQVLSTNNQKPLPNQSSNNQQPFPNQNINNQQPQSQQVLNTNNQQPQSQQVLSTNNLKPLPNQNTNNQQLQKQQVPSNSNQPLGNNIQPQVNVSQVQNSDLQRKGPQQNTQIGNQIPANSNATIRSSQEVNKNPPKWDPYKEYKREIDLLNYNPYTEVNQINNSQDLNKSKAGDALLKSTSNLKASSPAKGGKNDKTFNKDNIPMQKELKQLDAFYIDRIFQEIQTSLKQGPEFLQLQKDYKKFANKFQRKYESELLRNLSEEKRYTLFREISRMFQNEAQNQPIVSKIKRVVNYRLEELKRETRDNKWTILLLLFSSLMNWNLYNKDQLEKFNCLELPNDLRQKVWAMCLEEKEIQIEYRRKVTENRMLTISQFDVQIAKDCESFVSKHMLVEAFDPKMIYTMKVILSDYERKQERILSDHHYLICMPLMKAFGNSHYIMNPPSEMVGFYYKLNKMVKEIDPLVDYVVKHDEKYDALMTDLFMNAIYRLDEEVTEKITGLLNLDVAQQRNLLVLLVKRFVHSLGFEFLNLRITMFVWDHMIMRVYPMGIEIFIVMAISLICLKDHVLAADSWDNLVDMFYKQAKMIEFREFVVIYEEKFKDFNFYEPVYKDPELSEVEYSIDNEDIAAQEQSIVNDVTKKAPVKPIVNKHSTLLNRLQKRNENEESQLKELDPELEHAMAQNLKFEEIRHGEQVGMFPYVNIDEEEEDLLE